MFDSFGYTKRSGGSPGRFAWHANGACYFPHGTRGKSRGLHEHKKIAVSLLAFPYMLCRVLSVSASPSAWLYYTHYGRYVKHFDELLRGYAKNRHKMPIFSGPTLTAASCYFAASVASNSWMAFWNLFVRSMVFWRSAVTAAARAFNSSGRGACFFAARSA